MRRFPGPIVRGKLGYLLSEEQEQWLCRYFPVIENKRLIEAMGVGGSTLHRFARALGLKKSADGWQAIKRRQAAHIVELCERNGYYDSLRGAPPSARCRAGFQRYIADVRAGRRKHPYHVMRETAPKRYAAVMKKHGESLRQLIAKERRRIERGEAQQTRLRVPLNLYKRSQVSRRHNALKRGYCLNSDNMGADRFVIYYDDDTERSPLFERNCIKDGFRIEKWEE